MESEVCLPRVLVIASTPFSKTKNNGKTLSSFFEGYDRALIAQFSYSGGDCNEDVCDNYFVLTKDDVLSKRQGSAYRANELSLQGEGSVPARRSCLKKLFHILAQERLPVAVTIKDRIWKHADYTKAEEWIEHFGPDVVFFQGFSMAYGYSFVLDVCRKRDIPMILELTDDYTHRLYPLSILDAINHRRYMKVFQTAVSLAHKTIVISDLMKEEYEARFGGDMDVMMNAINEAGENDHSNQDEQDYVYAGNLLLNRWKVLRNLGRALVKTRPGAKLNIYTPDVPPRRILKALSKVDAISYGGRLTKEELGERLKTCGYVVHVEAFDRKNRKITRLSMSTKISEYVACGAQLLAIGPADVASMRCIADNELGICINGTRVSEIVEGLRTRSRKQSCEDKRAEFLSRCASNDNGTRVSKYIMDAVANHQRK